MEHGRSAAINVAMILALIALAVAGHYFSPMLLPKADVTGSPQPGCDLQRRPCAAEVPDGVRIELSITPRPIPYLQALNVEVRTRGIEVRKVEVDFAGASMNMGYNRTQLAAAADGRHTGEASLPVCVSGGMTWVATVLIETDRQRIAVPYRFDVGR